MFLKFFLLVSVGWLIDWLDWLIDYVVQVYLDMIGKLIKQIQVTYNWHYFNYPLANRDFKVW